MKDEGDRAKAILDEISSLLVYPYVRRGLGEGLRQNLISHNVSCPTYWPGEFVRGSVAWRFAIGLVCRSCDQRYAQDDMERILEVIHVQ